jgi:hypothetical protein
MSKNALAKHPKLKTSLWAASVYITLGFAVLYFTIGVLMLEADRYRAAGMHENDIFFQADSRYAVENLTQFDSHYRRVHMHPTFVIMFNPIGQMVNAIVQNPPIATSIVCALFGGINVGLLMYFMVLVKLPNRWVLLFGIIFGLSSTQLVFSTVPDTYVFSATGMIMILIAGVKEWRIQYWALITAYLLGITISNIVPAMLAVFFFVFSGRLRQVWEERTKVFYYVLFTGGVTAVLSLLQKLIYDSWLLSMLYRMEKDQQFLFIPSSWSEGFHRTIDLLEHILVFNVVAPFTSLADHAVIKDIQLLSFQKASLLDFSLSGLAAWPIWISVVALVAHLIIRYKLFQLTFVKACFAILSFHFVLHFTYGDDLMLYASHWTAILFGLIIFVLKATSVLEHRSMVPLGLGAFFCSSLAVNNSYLVHEMITAFTN